MQPEAQPHPPHKKKAKAHIQEEEASNYFWVVSYADMLMVLMSFFIIYFEMDSLTKQKEKERIEVPKPNVITQLVVALKDKAAPTAQTGAKAGNNGPPKPGTLQTIATQLKGGNVQLEGNMSRQSLTIVMRPDIFKAGQFDLKGADLEEFQSIMKAIMPLIQKLHVVVLGHTDDVPILHGRKQIVDTNFVLSTLRATKAAQQGVLAGVPQDRISAEAAADSARKTRSLSIKVILDTPEEASGPAIAPAQK